MKLRISIEQKVFEVEVEVLEGMEGLGGVPAPATTPMPVKPVPASSAPAPVAAPAPAKPAPAAAGGKVFPSPLSGTVRVIKVKPGDSVAPNQEVLVLEAMKMETSIYAPSAGTVKAILVKEGDTVAAGTGLIEFA